MTRHFAETIFNNTNSFQRGKGGHRFLTWKGNKGNRKKKTRILLPQGMGKDKIMEVEAVAVTERINDAKVDQNQTRHVHTWSRT
jgi:hypothetical protein